MVTHDRQIQNVDSINTTNVTFYGLSTDAKTTEGVGNGSCFIEMDTGKGYFFDLENNEWHEQSGGGSGGGGSTLLVNIVEDGSVWTCDKTWKEMHDAAMAGSQVWVRVYNESYRDATGLVTSFDNLYYSIYFKFQDAEYSMYAATENDYPSINFD